MARQCLARLLHLSWWRQYDQGFGIAVDESGNAYVTGLTHSTDFPTLNQYQSTLRGLTDAFVAKLAYSGSGNVSLAYSTYIGGTLVDGPDAGTGIAVDNIGSAYVGGYTESSDFPTLNPFQNDTTYYDAFVIKFSFPDNSLSVDLTALDLTALQLSPVTPNPARDQMQASFTLPEARTVTMEIYAIDGRLVAVPLKAASRSARQLQPEHCS